MVFDRDEHHRRSVRLRKYDYSGVGLYFVTICTADLKCIFGEIAQGKVQLSEAGWIVREEWLRTPRVRAEIELDAFVVMPNHFHGIVAIVRKARGVLPYAPTPSGGTKVEGGVLPYAPTPSGGTKVEGGVLPYAPTKGVEFRSPSRTLGALVRGFKGSVAKRLREMWNMPDGVIWQRNYYEHIIRNSQDMKRIQQYIYENPARWEEDENNPSGNKT